MTFIVTMIAIAAGAHHQAASRPPVRCAVQAAAIAAIYFLFH